MFCLEYSLYVRNLSSNQSSYPLADQAAHLLVCYVISDLSDNPMSILNTPITSYSRPRTLKRLIHPVSHLPSLLSPAYSALIDSIPRSLPVIISFQNGDIFENLFINTRCKFLNILISPFPQASSKVSTSVHLVVAPVNHQQKFYLLTTTSIDDFSIVVSSLKLKVSIKELFTGLL